MYELYIQDKNGDYQQADLGEKMPDMSYGANDIAQIENRNANVSMAIKLPKSPKNCQIFDFSHLPDSASDFPYRRHNCRLYSNGYTLAGKGSYITLVRTTDFEFETQILSGIADFLVTLKESPMSDLDLGYVIRGEGASNDIQTIPAISLYKNIEDDNSDKTLFLTPEYRIPVVYVKRTMEEICIQKGYELRHNLAGLWDNLAVNVCELKPYKDSVQLFIGIASNGRDWDVKANRSAFVDDDIIYNALGNMKIDNGLITYECQFDGEISIDFNMKVKNTGTGNPITVTPFIKNSNQENPFYNPKYILIGSGDEKNVEPFAKSVTVEKGDVIQLSCSISYIPGSSASASVEFSYVINNIQTEVIPLGAKLYLAPNLGFETQFDYFKAILQALGLTLNINESKKIVEIYTMKKLYDNKQYALDWTNKLHSKDSTRDFSLKNYAQRNYIKFNENSDDDITDEGYFDISNECIEKQKDLFTIPFESGKDNIVKKLKIFSLDQDMTPINVANIPLFNFSDDNGVFQGGKPHLLKLTPGTIISKGINIDILFANHVTVQSLIDEFYIDLTSKMLKKAKMFEAYFLIDEEDVEMYNRINQQSQTSGVFVPVYLHQWGAYFYVNDIKNFQGKTKLTKVQLVRM